MKNWCTEEKIEKLSDSAKNVLIMELTNHNKKLSEDLNIANEKLRMKQVEPYIPSSEQTPYLFNELEEIAKMLDDDDSYKDDNKKSSRKVSHKVRKLPANTPITVIDHTKDDPETITKADGYVYYKAENKVVDKIGFIPAKYYIERHIYSCYKLKDFEPEKGDVKSITLWDNAETDVLSASTSLVAKTVIKKYADSLPLYRQEQIFKRAGIDISRQALSNWLLVYAKLLEPLQKRFKYHLFQSPLINQDETPVKVLNLDKENPTKTRFMLVRIGTSFQNLEQERIIVQFSFIPNRKIETLSQDTANYDGYWMTDGLKGYLHLDKHINCWIHAERRLKKYLKVNKKNTDARKIVFIVGKLFTLEKNLRAKFAKNIISRSQFMKTRKKEAEEIFKELLTFLDSVKDAYPPKSEMGIGIKYFYTYWNSLILYPECFESSPSNNVAENSIRGFAVGRHNWLFSVSGAGADASALYYSIIETAKANNINTYDYLWYVLTQAQTCKTTEDWDALMPWNVSKEDLKRLHDSYNNVSTDSERTEDYIIRGSH